MSDSSTRAAGAATTAIMKADHEHWLAALARWRDDVHRWEAEHRAALVRLAGMQRAIEEHGRCLDDHAIACGRIEEAVAAHECLGDGAVSTGSPAEAVIRGHREQEAAFRRHEDAHSRIARHHEAVMECMRALESAARAAM